jgi:hypothetical protein
MLASLGDLVVECSTYVGASACQFQSYSCPYTTGCASDNGNFAPQSGRNRTRWGCHDVWLVICQECSLQLGDILAVLLIWYVCV